MIFKGKLKKGLSIALLVCYILLSGTISQSAKENVSTQADSSKPQNEIGVNKTVNTQSNNLQNNNGKDNKTSERIIVKFKDSSKADTIKNNVKSKLKLNKLDSKRKIKKTNIEVLEVDKSDLDITINGFKENSEVEYAQPDYLLSVDSIPQDERFSEQWGLYNSGQTINGQDGTSGIDVSAIEAWDVSTNSENATVGVLDTGIDINHSDLNSNIYINSNEIPNDGIDNDNNGYIDDVNGFDFANNDNTVYDSATYDKHGTHIAGIIAGKADNIGIRGVASNVKVMPLKFINGTTGYTSDAVEAIEYGKSMGIKIINCSFGSTYSNPALLDAMQNSSILFACAAGNSGMNIDNSPIYPACFNLPNIISVGAINNTGNLASFSNYGSKVNVVGPGKDILSTVPENSYEYMSGTSMATPFVTGAIALLSKSAEQLSNEQIKAKLCETATQIIGLNSYTYALVNIARALGVASHSDITPTPTEAPSLPDVPEKPQSSFDIIQKDVQFAEYRDKLKALEEQAISSDNIDIAKTIEEKLNNLIIKENKLRELSENYVIESKDQAELTNIQSEINSYYSTNASEFYNLEVEYQNLINEYVDIVQGNSAINTMVQSLTVNSSINVTLPVGNNQVFEFTAPNSSTYIFQTGPYMGTGSPNDTVLEIYTDATLSNRVAYDDDSAGNLFSKVSIFISKNAKYYIKLSPYKSTGSVYAKLSVIYDEAYFTNIDLNSPVDVSLATGEFKVFKYTPSFTSKYYVYTGPYAGTGGSNDTYLEIYTDAALTNKIAYNDDSAGNLFSIISTTLNAGTKYYIKLRHYSANGAVNARLTLQQNIPSFEQVVTLNSPVNVYLSTGLIKVFKFTPTSGGIYDMFTGPYGGTGWANDTYLELYSDAGLTNRLAYDDDSAGNLFSKIQTRLSPGLTYYIKLTSYNTNDFIFSNFTITNGIQNVTVNLNQSVDLQVAQNEYAICKFTPSVTGEYKLYTSPNASTTSSNDTYLELYTNQALTNMIAYDDDSGDGWYSIIQYKLNAGTTYYIKFRGWANLSACGSFAINLLSDTIAPSNPTNLVSSYTTSTTTNLSWTPSADNFEVATYDVCKDGIYLATTNAINYNVTGLTPATTYKFTVKAKDTAGNISSASNEVSVTTLSLSQITANIAYDIATKTVSINGSNPNGQGKQITILVKDPSGAIKYIDQLLSGTNGAFSLTFKINPTIVGIYTVTIGGEGITTPFNNNFTIANLLLPDTAAPAVPTNLVSSNTTATTTDLSWTASTDNVGVVGYDIYKFGAYLATTTTTNYRVTGLTPTATYIFTVMAKDAANNISVSSNEIWVKTIDIVAPSAPILATPNPESTTGTTVNLIWQASTDNVGVVGYDIYKDGTFLAATVNTNYGVTGLTASKSYKFKIKAKDLAGNVSESNEITVTPILVNAITANVNYDAYRKELSISGSSSNGQGKQITILVKDPNGAIKYIDQLISGTNGAFSLMFKINPTVIGVYTVSIGGDGITAPFTNNFIINDLSTTDTTPPTAPTNLVSSVRTGTTIDLSWGASTDNAGVVGYDVYKNGTYLATAITASYQVVDLLSTESYQFAVKAKDAAGNISVSSNEITVKTTDVVAPTAPTGLASNNITGTTIDLSWTATTDNVGVVGYDIYKDGTYLATTTNINYQAVELSIATTYKFTVKAKDGAGNISDASSEVTVTTLDTIPPTDPTNLISNNVTGTTVDLSWTVSTDNVGVVGYDVYKDGVFLETSVNLSYQATGLTSATEYKFIVKAKDLAGNISNASNEVAVATLDIIPPTDPTNLVSSNVTGTTVDLGWDVSTDNVGVVGYDIYKDGVFLVFTTNINYQITGLTQATTYKFSVKAKDLAGNISNASNEVAVITLDTIAPTVPMNLASSSITVTTVNLSWTASTDNVAVVGYDIYKDGVFLISTTNISYQVTGLTSVITYKFTVKARDAAGNISEANNEVTVTTLAQSSITANVTYNESTKEVTISGNALNGQGKQVTILVKDLNGVIKYIDQLISGVNGTFSRTFKINPTVIGNYAVKIGGDGIAVPLDCGFVVTTLTQTETQAPTAPTNLNSTAKTDTTIDLSWTASTDNIGVVGYEIYKDGVKLEIPIVAATNYQITGLTPSTAYKFTVKAKDAVGNISDVSNEVTATTTLDQSSITAILTYNENTKEVTINGYISNGQGKQITILVKAPNEDIKYIDQLISGVNGIFSRTCKINPTVIGDYAVKIGGDGVTVPLDCKVVVTTLTQTENEAPTAPSNLINTAKTDTTIDLSWTASTDNIGVVGYEVYKDGVKLDVPTIIAANYQITGLTPSTTYKFTVKAKDAVGNISNASNEVTIVTLDIIPPEDTEDTIIVTGAAGSEFALTLNLANVTSSTPLSFEISYNASEVEIIDLLEQIYGVQTADGNYNGIVVTMSSTGHINITFPNKIVPTGEVWNGKINVFKFKLKSGYSSSTVTVGRL